MSHYEPVCLDLSNVRLLRQRENDKLALDYLYGSNNIKNINSKEFSRVLADININKEELMKKCREDLIFAKVLSGRISIKSSRQGTKDEKLQIETCNELGLKLGIQITNLKVDEFRPTKNGCIIDSNDFKTTPKSECLKSFDGIISGKINGWIFAKVVYGSGGHQDNVFEESYNFCEWVLDHGIPNELYVVLIDTDMKTSFDCLKDKYHKKKKKNLLIVDHVEFQNHLIKNYS